MMKKNPFEEIEAEITALKKLEIEQAHTIEELTVQNVKAIDSFCTELLSVLDAFDKADLRLSEQYTNNEDVNKARKRFLTSRRKLVSILEKYHVQEIEFPEGKATLNDCQIVDTEPDSDKEPDTIISIEKSGYRREGRLLRLAEVVVVKN